MTDEQIKEQLIELLDEGFSEDEAVSIVAESFSDIDEGILKRNADQRTHDLAVKWTLKGGFNDPNHANLTNKLANASKRQDKSEKELRQSAKKKAKYLGLKEEEIIEQLIELLDEGFSEDEAVNIVAEALEETAGYDEMPSDHPNLQKPKSIIQTIKDKISKKKKTVKKNDNEEVVTENTLQDKYATAFSNINKTIKYSSTGLAEAKTLGIGDRVNVHAGPHMRKSGTISKVHDDGVHFIISEAKTSDRRPAYDCKVKRDHVRAV